VLGHQGGGAAEATKGTTRLLVTVRVEVYVVRVELRIPSPPCPGVLFVVFVVA
jgi:hypothetical protein